MNKKPTPELYDALQFAYDFLNEKLFSSELPQCILTLGKSGKSVGYFSPRRFVNVETKQPIDEIAMNPEVFNREPTQETLGTLVHEMVHLWQEHFGKTCRRTYHNKEWADKMEQVGRMPSHTGEPGGNRCGQKMSDYNIPGSPFDIYSNELLQNQRFKIAWMERVAIVPSNTPPALMAEIAEIVTEQGGEVVSGEQPKTKRKYSHVCDGETKPINVWGKPGLSLACGHCGEIFEEVKKNG